MTVTSALTLVFWAHTFLLSFPEVWELSVSSSQMPFLVTLARGDFVICGYHCKGTQSKGNSWAYDGHRPLQPSFLCFVWRRYLLHKVKGNNTGTSGS